MPEGDSILHTALRLRPVLIDQKIEEIVTPQRRHAADRWPKRLTDHTITSIDTYGKNLFLRFDNGLSIYSHLRMTGGWHIYEHGGKWKRSKTVVWLVIRTEKHEIVQFRGPVLELMSDTRRRNDPRLQRLSPDVLAEQFDEGEFIDRLRESDPTRPFGDVLLDQSVLAGIGNIWRAEACWEAEIDPWRPTNSVDNDAALKAVRSVIPRMLKSARADGPRDGIYAYGRAGRPCIRCKTKIRSRGQGDDNRIAYWCPGCQK